MKAANIRIPERPVLLYDGDCGFCRRWVTRWYGWTGGKVDYAPYQEAGAEYPQIPIHAFRKAVQFVDLDGSVYPAAEGVFRGLDHAPGKRWMLALYLRLPLFAPISEAVYRQVARRRTLFSSLSRWIWGNHLVPPPQSRTVWLYLRILGLIYLSAFVSLWLQIDGLIGEEGIVPAGQYLNALNQRLGPERYRLLPTLAWLNPTDGFFHLMCAAGTLLSIVLAAGVLQVPALAALWALYLSLCSVGSVFLSFQWDTLLLEVGFLSIFLARPWVAFARPDTSEPPRWAVWLLRLLLFKLMFMSGCVKLLSLDPAWRDLTALLYHYETQPLVPWTAWFIHKLPIGFHKASVGGMFAVELAVPFLFFLPRRIRAAGAAATTAFMVIILLTGNYCFFNLLALALCLLLLDDGHLAAILPNKWGRRIKLADELAGRNAAGSRGPARSSALAARVLGSVLLLFYGAVCSAQLGGMLAGRDKVPPAAKTVLGYIAPFRTFNTYGLFAVMTITRPEIIVEGSDDGVNWKPYGFKWKAGDPTRRPRFNIPHQPRLDWQMWFASLGTFRQNPWLSNFLARLLQGSKPVLGLLGENPFPNKPPKFIRTKVYYYNFTDWEEGWNQGTWWTRHEKGPYSPVVSLRER